MTTPRAHAGCGVLRWAFAATLLAGALAASRAHGDVPYAGHPRLLFTAPDIPALRARVASEAVPRRVYGEILADARRALDVPVDSLTRFMAGSAVVAELGLAAALEPADPAFRRLAHDITLEVARRWNVDTDDFGSALRLRTLAFGYDLAFADASAAERVEVQDEILAYLAFMTRHFNYWRYLHRPYASNRGATVGAAMGLAVLAVRGDVPAGTADALDTALTFADGYLRVAFDALLPDDGAYREGVLYAAWALRMALPYFEARRAYDGTDFAAPPRFQRLLSWLCYELLPEGRGRTNNINDSLWKTSPLAMHSTVLDWAQWRFHDPLAEYLEAHVTGEFGYDYHSSADRVATVLWNRPGAVPDPGRLLPAGRLFAARGLYAYRSGWKTGASGDEVLFTFFSGPFGGGHAQEDQNSFTLYANGDRYAIDCGNAAPSAKPKESEAHNVILIDGRGQHNAGNSIGTDGRIAAALLSPFADYVRGDAGAAYATYSPLNAPGVPFPSSNWSWGYDGGNPVVRADRSMLVIKGAPGPVIVLGDDIQKDTAAHDYDWVLHTDLGNRIDGMANPLHFTGRRSSLDLYFPGLESPPGGLSASIFDHGGDDPMTRRLLLRRRSVAPGFVAAFVPRQRGDAAPHFIADRLGNATFLALRRAGVIDLVVVAPDHAPEAAQFQLGTDGRMAAARMVGGDAHGYLLAEGTMLRVGGRFLAATSEPASLAMAGDSLCISSDVVDFRAFGPNVVAVLGPAGPRAFERDGDDVRSPSAVAMPLAAAHGAHGASPDGILGLPSRNPFRSRVTFALPPAAPPLEVAVFDLRGRRVCTLLTLAVERAPRSLEWDGRDDAGARLPAGLYFVRAVRGAEVATRKVLLTR